MTKSHRSVGQLHDQQPGQTDQSYYQHRGDRAASTTRTNREKTRRNRTGRGDVDDSR
ncbi:unnamed protein product, partial [Hymenolepis diminuta]